MSVEFFHLKTSKWVFSLAYFPLEKIVWMMTFFVPHEFAWIGFKFFLTGHGFFWTSIFNHLKFWLSWFYLTLICITTATISFTSKLFYPGFYIFSYTQVLFIVNFCFFCTHLKLSFQDQFFFCHLELLIPEVFVITNQIFFLVFSNGNGRDIFSGPSSISSEQVRKFDPELWLLGVTTFFLQALPPELPPLPISSIFPISQPPLAHPLVLNSAVRPPPVGRRSPPRGTHAFSRSPSPTSRYPPRYRDVSPAR